MELRVVDNERMKLLASENYNFAFNKKTGFFARWGKTQEEDPPYSPYGPEIADIEITTVCGGVPNAKGITSPCGYCYKKNTSVGKNMPLETLQKLIEKINVNNQLTQVAFGLGATGEENPELWKMVSWLKSIGIISNGTIANITDETAKKIATNFGACAVSFHGNKDVCYNSIKKLTDNELMQTNMHFVIHEDNFDELLSVVSDIKTDERLEKLNAIVLLSLKQKGRAEKNFKVLSQEKFNAVMEVMTKEKINYGMDSCSSHKYLEFVKNTDLLSETEKENCRQMVEPCESQVFSSYFNVDGLFFPCSFSEGTVKGISVIENENFINNIWNMGDWRSNLLKNNRHCPIYNI